MSVRNANVSFDLILMLAINILPAGGHMRRFVKICIAIISVFLVYQFIFSSGTFSAPWLFDTKYRSFYEFSKSSEKKFQSNLNSISESEALLSDLVDFNWDLACPVGPYDSAYRVLGINNI